MDSDTYFLQSNDRQNGLQETTITVDGFSQDQQNVEQVKKMHPKMLVQTETISSVQQFDVIKNEAILEKNKGFNSSMVSFDSPHTSVANPDAIIPKERSYTCRICQKTFPNKSAVTHHSREHTDHQGKPYSCNFCGKGFSTNFYVKQHERIHSGHKPYKCPMCETSFKQLSHVQQHVRTHTGVRPYNCHWPGCSKSFLQQSHLKSHEDRHVSKASTSLQSYKCHWPGCSKSFGQLTNLKTHIMRHTPGKVKTKKAITSSKKSDATNQNSEDVGSISSLDVINQAATVANIVPGEEQVQIRPFLCPGCSKLYVREATFKKHLEECRTKLQLSISATALALGIHPPPPLSDTGLESTDLLLTPVTSPYPPSKRAKSELEPNPIATSSNEVTFHINVEQDISGHSRGISGTPVTEIPRSIFVKNGTENSNEAIQSLPTNCFSENTGDIEHYLLA